MPTAYTQAIIEKDISFTEFTKLCSRAFGALISMKEDSLDKPIPTEFIPSDYFRKAAEDYKKELNEWNEWNDTSIDKLKIDWATENKRKLDDALVDEANKIRLKKKLTKMLIQVKLWIPPTSKHQGLKDFMIEQINDTIQWDCIIHPRDKIVSFDKWKKNKKASLVMNIKYYEKQYAEEVKTCAERTKWVQDLLKSL